MAGRYPWLRLSDGLENEIEQLKEEGRRVDKEFEDAVRAVLELPDGHEKDIKASKLFEQGQALPYLSGENEEPDALEDIFSLAEGNPAPESFDRAKAYDRIYGAWLGRCAGCLLGKPVEGWHTPEIHRYLRESGNYPLSRYIRSMRPEDAGRAFIDQVDCMPEDDDTNYTVIGLKLVEEHGRDFKPEDAADCWLRNLPILHLCTAERAAYRNLVMSIDPSASATYCNGYREWIGAQIRADLFGYINPGDPHTAAAMAWRDASISHVKNGIYGEMFVAAMLAKAAVSEDTVSVIRAGLNEIPRRSRLHTAVEDVLTWHGQGASYDEAIQRISARWDEYNPHHWCHTISNAQIVAAALLYGGGELGTTLCKAVMPGFDTDCNGATAGSV
ncbi:MAG: ADP-ribosylglycohydrolase family protein, partial [Clostridia bacterium]|nr:ADP-ribosylglycohydrolase family protein [Clostridia bacterium]